MEKSEPIESGTSVPIPTSDPSLIPNPSIPSERPTFSAFRDNEGPTKRRKRLKLVFERIESGGSSRSATSVNDTRKIDGEDIKIEELRNQYARELHQKCSGPNCPVPSSSSSPPPIDQSSERWTAFEKYAEEKEKELWKLFVKLDSDGNMILRKEELKKGWNSGGVEVKDVVMEEFIDGVGTGGEITFEDWRDSFLLLPRPTSMSEILTYWHTHRANRPSMSQLTQDGDVVVGRGKTGWNKLLGSAIIKKDPLQRVVVVPEVPSDRRKEEEIKKSVSGSDNGKGKERETFVTITLEEDDEGLDEGVDSPIEGMLDGAGKFLLAGGLAGAVSRTATAPFDRLKVYLITSPTIPLKPPSLCPSGSGKSITPRRSKGSLPAAVRAVWKQGGGPKAFWTGNGLNVVKIFPESAIKFLSYESAKRLFAQYVDQVPDQTLISNSSRFVAGGIGGVVSQFVIYPIETLKTRVMSSTGGKLKGTPLILSTAASMWRTGGIRLYFKGLTAGLIGVFPYSAIDMSTFEGIKLAYTKWAGKEPGIVGSLGFGAFSGGIGASSVYPLNLIRTRLQAQGTPAHPQTYDGVRDAANRCYKLEGWRGFYKGLTPTLVKVVPAVAISYAVYDLTKKALFAREELESQREHDALEE